MAAADDDSARTRPTRRRILICSSTSWALHNVRRNLIARLVQMGHEVIAAAPTDAYTQKLVELGCRHVDLPIDNTGTSIFTDLRLFLRFRRLMAEWRPDLFLGFTVKPNIYGSLAARLARVPAINNVTGLGSAFAPGSRLRSLVIFLYRRALRRAHQIFFQNADDQALFRTLQIGDDDRTALLPGSGIDLTHFTPGPASEAAEGRITFLLVARLIREKGIEEYVAAARTLQPHYPALRFQILGPLEPDNPSAVGQERLDHWQAEGLITYLGETDDVRPALRAADCIVLPSYYREGVPRSLLEGAALEKPVIATDMPGCRDAVIAGETGLLCRPRDPQDLARQMVTIGQMPASDRRAMGQAGRLLMARKFDEGIVIDRYMTAINAVFAGQ